MPVKLQIAVHISEKIWPCIASALCTILLCTSCKYLQGSSECKFFQLFMGNFVNVYEWKLMFDPSNLRKGDRKNSKAPQILDKETRDLSRIMRKPTFCICKNKDADQLRGNREADQRLCFRYIDSTIPLLSKSEISSV